MFIVFIVIGEKIRLFEDFRDPCMKHVEGSENQRKCSKIRKLIGKEVMVMKIMKLTLTAALIMAATFVHSDTFTWDGAGTWILSGDNLYK